MTSRITVEEIDRRLATETQPLKRLLLEQRRARLRGVPYYRGQTVPIRVYNYPWSGKLGRLCLECLVCGDKGPSFQASSRGDRCLNCPWDAKPDPKRAARYRARMERGIDQWCAEQGINRKEVEDRLRARYGEPNQDMLVVRDELEVKAYLEARTPEEMAWAKKRGFPLHYLEGYARYGMIGGQPELNPFEDGPPFESPG